MGWGEVGQSGGGRADFLTIEDGGSAKVHVLLGDSGEPHSFWSIFFNGVQRSAIVADGDNEHPAAGLGKGYEPRRKHAVNVYNYETGKVEILEGGNKLFEDIKAVFDEYGTLDDVDLKISRKGSKKSTKYSVIPVASKFGDVDADSLELFNLEERYQATDNDTIQAYVDGYIPEGEGQQSGGDDDAPPPAKKKAAPPAEEEAEGEEAAAGEEAPAEEGEDAPPPKKTGAKPPAAAAKGAAPAGNRAALIQQLNKSKTTLQRYRKEPKLWLVDLKKFGGKNAVSLAQLEPAALSKFAAFVKTQK